MAYGVEFDPERPEEALERIGPLARMIGATLRHTLNPTRLDAGYKTNVIPQSATAQVDGRFLPGFEDDFFATVDELLGPGVERDFVHHDHAVETEYEGALVAAMEAALTSEDPGALPVPYCLSGGTDAKHFIKLGMRSYGFTPLRLPDDLDFTALFHGVDERVPVDALEFGTRVLDRLLDQV